MSTLLQHAPNRHTWVDGIDVSEHHQIDFTEVRRQGAQMAIIRAGRGTRQDARWVEHGRAAALAGLSVGSYWHLYPSHTSAHHQAELWVAAIRSAHVEFHAGHWADVSTTDGFDPSELGRYVAAFLRRADELIGHTVGVCTPSVFWRCNVRFDISDRPRWELPPEDVARMDGNESELARGAFAVRTQAADRGGPGHHRVLCPDGVAPISPMTDGAALVPRGPNETIVSWQRRWVRTPEVAALQEQLNELGAALLVDGVYGPATDAAVKTWGLLRRRDHLDDAPLPFGPGHRAATARTTAV
jgi:hypothetical protein